MHRMFMHPGADQGRSPSTDPARVCTPAGAPADPARVLALADRSCCCPARPAVMAVMPPAAGRPHPVDLLLCGHHYVVSKQALSAAGATIYVGRTGLAELHAAAALVRER